MMLAVFSYSLGKEGRPVFVQEQEIMLFRRETTIFAKKSLALEGCE